MRRRRGDRPGARGPVLAGLVALVLAGCAQSVHEAAWDDLVTARQQDAIERGWIPEWLPESATDLVERNHPESGEVVVRAILPADQELAACTVAEPDPARPDLGPDWWDPTADAVAHTCENDWSVLRDGDLLWAWKTGDTVDSEESP